jgi:hypothetical protein
MAPVDPPLDERAREFLRQRVIEAAERAGRHVSPAQADAMLASTRQVGRRVKSARDAYIGYMLLILESSGLPAARACEIVDWFARGRPTPQPTSDRRVSRDQRHRRLGKCRALDRELREAGLDPPPEPALPTQRQREAFTRREEDGRIRQAERLAERPPQVEIELSYDEFASPLTVAGVVNLILAGEPVAPSHAVLEQELRAALRELDDVAPGEFRALVRWTRGECPLYAGALHWLVACAPAARRERDRRLAQHLPSSDDAHRTSLVPIDPATVERADAGAPIRWAA